ncbi:MAG: SpoVA/SpoVAEb family sporulation membrane protein [Clostridia bacterium]|nr:SpoVA/SpoVAEb family sporulation membrane protein [Clostridia bacterium]
MVEVASSPSPIIKDTARAFLVGGGICVLGQLMLAAYSQMMADQQSAKTLVSVTLIFVAAVLTGFGVFDKIAKFSGAGTLVPITGFANAVVSPAIEYKAEGFVLGDGAKMFTIAGPVIVYGTVASVVYGVIYWITTLF